MRKLFIILGSIAALLGLGLGLAGLFLIEEHRKEMNRKQTKKARDTRLNKSENNSEELTPTEEEGTEANPINDEK